MTRVEDIKTLRDFIDDADEPAPYIEAARSALERLIRGPQQGDRVTDYPDGHPWQFAGDHWVRVKKTGLVSRIADSDKGSDGALLFALHDSEDPCEWFMPSELESASPPEAE